MDILKDSIYQDGKINIGHEKTWLEDYQIKVTPYEGNQYNKFIHYLFTPNITVMRYGETHMKPENIIPSNITPEQFLKENFKYIFIERLLNNIERFLEIVHLIS